MSSPENFGFGLIDLDVLDAIEAADKMQPHWQPVPLAFAEDVYALASADIPMQGGDPTLRETHEPPANAGGNPGGYVDRQTGQPLSADELDRLAGGWSA